MGKYLIYYLNFILTIAIYNRRLSIKSNLFTDQIDLLNNLHLVQIFKNKLDNFNK